MKTEAKIIKDSINKNGNRITSFILTYPRFIHSEFMTHRVFSRNAASSRAIPIQKMIDDVQHNTASPIHWGKNQKGMQAFEEISKKDIISAQLIWHHSRDLMIKQVLDLMKLGVHKQVCNRLLEPFMYIRVLATATEYTNFFKLRAHKDAQPEIQDLAYKMLDAYKASNPKLLNYGEWHIPFSEKMPEGILFEDSLKVATARAARLSYNNFDGNIDLNSDIQLHDSLLHSKHFSPFEHCACATEGVYDNFVGWRSYRNVLIT